MGGAMISSLLDMQFCTPESIMIADRSEEKLKNFERKGCMVSQSADNFISEADIIILATKPQVLLENLVQWQELFEKEVVLISIAAGVSINSIEEASKQKKVMRVMPNTPLLVSKGVCGWYGNENIKTEEEEVVQKMLNCFGIAIKCSTEDMIDKITALSGSGPAYYFYLLEHMANKAVEFGFNKRRGRKYCFANYDGSRGVSM